MMSKDGDQTNKTTEKILVGSRESKLALIQTNHVIDLLKEEYPDKEFEITKMSTLGDKILDQPLPKIGDKGLFTKELEYALEEFKVQFVVHSLKDLPTKLPDSLAVGAVLKREDPRDALVLNKNFEGKTLATLPKGSVIGTSSLRRTAQLAHKHPHLKVENIRGNLTTRLKKLDTNQMYSAIILAMAGLKRMGEEGRVSQALEESDMMYAVGQGALAVECRADDMKTVQLLQGLHHPETCVRVIAERSFLHTLGGGCSAPVAVVSEVTVDEESKQKKLKLEGAVWNLSGTKLLRKSSSCFVSYKKDDDDDDEPPKKTPHLSNKTYCGIMTKNDDCYEEAFLLGKNVATELINDGAIEIMDEARKHNDMH